MRRTTMFALLVLPIACGEQPPTSVRSPIAPGTGAASLEAYSFVKIPDADFGETDVNRNGTICAKDTPSGHLVLLDDNEATPSQPCPPPFAMYGKGASVGIGVIKEGDDNRNGKVCVKKTPGGLIIRDDNIETPSQPCPPAFEIVSAVKDATPKVDEREVLLADVNRNASVCLRQTEAGDFMVRDDNAGLPSQPCPPAYLLYQLGGVIIKPEER